MQTEKLTIIAGLILLLTASSSGLQYVLHVELEYDHGNVSIQKVDLAEGYPPNIVENTGPYTLRLTDEEGRSVRSRSFGFDREISRGGKLNRTSRTLTFIYKGETRYVKAYRNYTKIDEAEIRSSLPKIEGMKRISTKPSNTAERQNLPIDPLLLLIAVLISLVLYLSIVPDPQGNPATPD